MKPITVVIPAGGTIDVPIDQYLTPENLSWFPAAGVTVTGLVGEMNAYGADGRPANGSYSSSAGAPSGSGIWQQPGAVTETVGVAPTGYQTTGVTLTQPVSSGAYSALRVAGTAGTTVIINQAGVR